MSFLPIFRRLLCTLILHLCVVGFFDNAFAQQTQSSTEPTSQSENGGLLGMSFDENTKTLPTLPLEVELILAKIGQNRYRTLVLLTNIGNEPVAIPFEKNPARGKDNDISYRKTRKVYGMTSVTILNSKGGLIGGFVIGHFGNVAEPSSVVMLAKSEKLLVDFHSQAGFHPESVQPGRYRLEVQYSNCSFDLPEIIHVAGVAKAQKVSPPVVFEVKEKTILE